MASKYPGQLVVQLNKMEVFLIICGARDAQDTPRKKKYAIRYDLSENHSFLLHSGAKLYPLGGGWYRISGYGYGVRNAMPHRFKVHTLRIDESDTLRTLGFAV